jgi:hypothetical protein
VQLVLGHALLTTRQLYLTPREEDVIRRILAHRAEQIGQARQRARAAPAPGYRREHGRAIRERNVVTAGDGVPRTAASAAAGSSAGWPAAPALPGAPGGNCPATG